jgi:KDO2-lipid IV(A) lauroyltransferase
MNKKFLSLIHPRYWLTWLGLGILYVINKLPYKIQLKIGQYLGRCAFHLFKRFRHIARVNLSLCFPELSEAARQILLRRHFESLGMGVIESTMSYWTPSHKLAALIQVQGLEHLQEAQAKKRGTIVLSGHFTSLEICGRLFSNIFPMYVVYREQKNQIIDTLLKRHRNFQLMQPIHRHDIRQIIKALKKNAALWYAADQDYGKTHSIFSPFFNISTATITTPSRYAKRSHAQALTLFYYRLPQGKGYQIIISPVLETFDELTMPEASLYFNQLLEKAIRAYPEQYLWIHRRFKTRPVGENSFY